jgi:PAS domain S-box-containing protein
MAVENRTPASNPDETPDAGLDTLHTSLFHHARDGIIVFEINPQGLPKIVEANPHTYSILGYGPNEVPLDAMGGIITSAGSNEIITAIQNLSKVASPPLQVRLQRRDGAVILLDIGIDLVRHDGKEYAMLLMRDITTQGQEEAEIKKNEARFRVIFEMAPMGIMLQNKDRKMVDCNHALSEMTGIEKDELLLKKQEELVHQEDVEKDARLFDLLMAGRIDHYNVEKRFLTHDGRVIYGSLHVSSIRDHEGKPEYALNMLSDITQRKRMEVEVLRTRDYYQSILDNMPTLMWRSNDQLMREFFNKAWLGFTGRTFNEEYGHGWMRGVHPDDIDRLMEAQERSFLTQENFEIEYRLLAFDNQYHWMIDMARPFYDSHGDFKGYVGSVHDNTRWRKMQEKSRQSQQKALMN